MSSNYTYVLLTLLFITSSCGTLKKPYYKDGDQEWSELRSTPGKELLHSLYLVGDAGELDDPQQGTNYVLEALKNQLNDESQNSSLVYLGDNIYPAGLPEEGDPLRVISEKKINAQLEAARNYAGDTYFVPGNHDWNEYHSGGLAAVQRQEQYIQSYYKDKKVKMLPNKGCGDPEVVKIHKDLVFIFIDSQWWLQDWSKERNINRGCDIKSRYDLLERMKEEFTDHKNDEIVVLMHHPIKSNGLHGGNFSWKHHIFPLHELGIWVPLPVIGSAYPMYRQATGSKQDITNENNEALMQELSNIAKGLRINVIFAAGHEHGLQYFNSGRLKYVVSGAGSKKTFTRKGGEAAYAREARGYARVLFYENSESWIEYYTVDGFNSAPILEYRAQVREPRAGTVEEAIEYPPVSESSITLPANENFAAGGMKKTFLGAQYRDIWTTPVTVPIIDLEKRLGGLVPVKKGGGMASNSLRMEHESGKQYILRSINKDYRKLVPPGFENLKLLDVLKDQNSASHPYGALMVPPLSVAAGVYYTSPKLVYLQHQKGLGNYNSQFPEELYLLEERPSGDWGDAAQFGNSEKIISYADLLEILRVKKNHFVDQEWVLKSRLFDIFIHDWDRHDDQWRWASFEEDDKTVYRPIPRDRDQAFYKFQGVLPWYISSFLMRKFKGMKHKIKDVENLSFNAKTFDRYFLNELEWSTWESVIRKLQEDITTADIDNAIAALPDEVEDIDRDDVQSKLISRKSDLLRAGRKLYEFLSKEVEITGSDNKDHFEVKRYADGRVLVEMHIDRSKKGELPKYSRVFYPEETNEIRLYGLRGKDHFEIEGSDNNSIRIRVIGGEGEDELANMEGSGRVHAYDTPRGIKLKGYKIKDHTSASDLNVNDYDRSGFKYNTSFPIAFFGFTPDDGLWLGGSVSWTKMGWRKDPFKSQHSLSASIAPGSQNAFRVAYNGHFTDVLGSLDFTPELAVNFPRYENYFGLGNNSVNELRDIRFNWVRIQSVEVNPLLSFNTGLTGTVKIGPTFESIDVDLQEGRVSTDESLGFSEEQADRSNFLGFTIIQEVGFVDNAIFPHNGFKVHNSFSLQENLSTSEGVRTLTTDLHFYLQLFAAPEIVLATNIGYDKVWGQPQFYQYADLGNRSNLRGFRNNRFRGESAFFQNIDLRMHLFEWNNNIVPMHVGILGGYDYGRVWLSGEESDTWHNSMTVGIFMEILGSAILQPYYSFNNERNQFSLKLGFNF